MNRLITLTAIGLLLGGCDAVPQDVAPSETTYPESWAHAMPTEAGPAELLPSASPSEAEGKRARRMSVHQLRRSIPALFDGITWTIPTRAGEQPGFDVLASTLGEADYIRATQNNEDPSPLFAKFMDDMAASVCRQAIERDRGGGGGAPLVLAMPDDVPANLRFLRLKLHGIHVPEGSTEGLDDLMTLHAEISANTNDSNQAWWGVCMAMLTAPEMLAY